MAEETRSMNLTPEEENLILKNRAKAKKREIAKGVASLEDLYKDAPTSSYSVEVPNLKEFLNRSNILMDYADKYLKKSALKKYHTKLINKFLASGWVQEAERSVRYPSFVINTETQQVTYENCPVDTDKHRFNISDVGYITFGHYGAQPILHYLDEMPCAALSKKIQICGAEIKIRAYVDGLIVKYEVDTWSLEKQFVGDSVDYDSPVKRLFSHLYLRGPEFHNKVFTEQDLIKEYIYVYLKKCGTEALARSKQYQQDAKIFLEKIKNIKQDCLVKS